MHWRAAAALGPLYVKETLEIARRRRYFVARAVFAGCLLLAMFSVWGRYFDGRSLPSADYARLQTAFAADLFKTVGFVQLAAIHLLVPMFVCGIIAGERIDGSLELLFITQLEDREIVVGKAASRIVALTLLLAAGLPVLALSSLFGGVGPIQLLRLEAASVALVAFMCCLSVYHSVRCSSPLTALMSTYIVAAALTIVPYLSPTWTLLDVLRSDPDRSSGYIDAAKFTASLVPSFVAAGVCLSIAVAKLRESPAGGDDASNRWSLRRLARARAELRRRRLEGDSPEETEVRETTNDSPDDEPTTEETSAHGALWGPLRIPLDEGEPALRDNLWVFGVVALAFAICFFIFRVV
ncbi:MAG: ABC transporter permease, partial [Planctomycetia bacterium]